MGFNQQKITLHGLHVHDNARFSVGFLCRSVNFIRLLRVVFSSKQLLNRPAVNAVQ